MCGGSPPKDNSADIARQQEAERQALIKQGEGTINQTFQQFDAPFYAGREKAYDDYYNPQLDDQYTKARKALVYSLSRAGNLSSGSGAQQLGDLKQQYDTQRGAISSGGIDYANQARTNVENARSDLLAENRAAADPSGAASQAVARAGTLTSAPSFNPLANVFADIVNNAANSVVLSSLAGSASGQRRGTGSALFAPDRNSIAVVK